MTQTIDIPGLPNLMNPAPGYASGGQPDAEQLALAAQAGIRRVINLRPPTEAAGYDEVATAARLGLEYHVVPIAGAQDLNIDTVRRFDALLNTTPAVPTLVHCASGNRVGALAALRAAWVEGQATDAALDTGRRWGLKNMEAVVRKLLA